jgi:hypothetical protein
MDIRERAPRRVAAAIASKGASASVLCAWLLLLVSGCTRLAGGARLDDPGIGTPREFPGMLPADVPPDASPRTHYLFVIHGMATADPDYSRPLLEAIEKQGYAWNVKGGYVPVALLHPLHVSGEALNCQDAQDSPPCTYNTFGRVKVDRLERQGAAHAAVVVFTYFWHDYMALLKTAFLGKDRSADTGALINTKIKRELMDDGFGDATGYLGARTLVRQGIEGALSAMLVDASGSLDTNTGTSRWQLSELDDEQISRVAKMDYSFLSFSLGSRMLYDALSDFDTESEAVSNLIFAARTKSFFMAANQMPLLGLGEMTVTDQRHEAVSVFSTMGENCSVGFFALAACLREQKSGPIPQLLPPGFVLSANLEVVAFHDPADLLGFRATGGLLDPKGTRFVEVRHRNTPVILFLLAWPPSAHATELEHDDSLLLILCGGTANANGRLQASRCL